MKKKLALSIGLAIGGSVLLVGGISFYQYYHRYPIKMYEPNSYQAVGKAVPGNVLTEQEVKEDAEEMIQIMESTHPIFLEGETDRYREAKGRFIQESSKSMTVDAFRLSVSRYMSSIQDGHTMIGWGSRNYLDVDWKYIEGDLVLFDENKGYTNKVVTKINGIQIDQIVHTIRELFPAENDAAESMNYSTYTRVVEVLAYAGVDCTGDMVLTVQWDDIEEEIPVALYRNTSTSERVYEISSERIDESIIYVKLEICDVNEELYKVAEDLKQALADGVKNVIIDVRDNPGGNSQACSILMDALKIKPGQFGAVIRFSPLAKERYGYLQKSGFITYERSNDVVRNPDIDLYILTNEQTFSSAQWMATWVKDGELGTIVGRPSSNMPSSFGDVLPFQLQNSKLEGQISYKKWTRPDAAKDQERALEPDIYVNYKGDELSKVLEMIPIFSQKDS